MLNDYCDYSAPENEDWGCPDGCPAECENFVVAAATDEVIPCACNNSTLADSYLF